MARTFSHHQDIALALCIERFGTCPFGCGKDGAPNCHVNVTGFDRRQCIPGRLTQAEADDYERERRRTYRQERLIK